jgi:hypothetical protein
VAGRSGLAGPALPWAAVAVDASRGGDRFQAWLRRLDAAAEDPAAGYDGLAVLDIVGRFADRTEFTMNMMPGAAGPDWLQVLNEPGWTPQEKVLLTVAAGLHTGSRVFRLRVTALLDLDDADLDLVLTALRRGQRVRGRARPSPG